MAGYQNNNEPSEIFDLLSKADDMKFAGRHQEAIKVCEKILINDLNCVEAYEEIGDNYLSLREYEKSQKALRQGLKINPFSANANYLLGFVFSSIGKWKESIDHLERSDDLQPNHPEILRCLGWSIFHYGQRKRGVIILERALNLAPQDVLIICDLGVCYLNERNFERSINLFSKALQIEPENQKARECLETARFFSREYKKLKGNKIDF